MKRQYEAPVQELLFVFIEENILSDQINPGIVEGDDDY